MGKKPHNHGKVELLQGTLELLILQTLLWGPQHGYGVGQAIRMYTDGVLDVETGSLYPALHRLEREGWVKGAWKSSGNGQPIKEYRITASGKKQLTKSRSRWETFALAVAGVLHPATGKN